MASRRAGGAAAALLLQSRRAAAMAVGRHASGAAGAPAAAGAAAPDFPGPVRAALVRGLPSSFAGGLKMQEPGQAIDMALAARQHGAYEALLRELVRARGGQGSARLAGRRTRCARRRVPCMEPGPAAVF